MAIQSGNRLGIEAVWDNSQFQKGQSEYVSKIQQANSATSAATAGMGGFGTILAGAVAGGLAAVAFQAIPAVINGLVGITKAAMEPVMALQRLSISLETLSARELVQSGQAANMEEALAKAVPVADALLRKIRDLAIESPFEYQDVVQVFRLNMAFGQGITMSTKLTKAMLDVAAGVGLSSAMIDRIAYNFSQMNIVGKITMRDVRDLAMAGVDLSGVLRDSLGKSIEEVNEALARGDLTMRDVSQAFVDYADTNFGGAAQRMSRTLGGLISSFKDLAFFAAADVFGPATERVTLALGGLMDKAMDFVDSGALTYVGAGLDLLVEQFLGFAGKAGGAISEFAGTFGADMAAVASNSVQYGINIVVQLANGLIMGAGQAIAAAMAYINRLLTGWLRPGSPPKVVPDVTKWGIGTAEAWLEGFNKADFDILKGIQQPLKQALGVLEQSGALKVGQSGKIFASVSKSMMQALKGEGDPGDSFYSKIAKSAGVFGSSLAELAHRQVDVAKATNEVKAAEDRLEAARKAAAASGLKVNALTQEYNDMLRSGADEKSLRNKLAQINLSKKEQTIANANAAKAENDIDLAKERLGLMNEQLSLQKDLVDQLIELARAQIKPAAAVVPPATGAVTPAEPGGPQGWDPVDPGDLGVTLEQARQAIIDALKRLFQPIKDWWNTSIKPIWNQIVQEAGAIWAKIKPILSAVWNWMKSEWQSVINFMEGWWDRHGQSVVRLATIAWQGILFVYNGAIAFIRLVVATFLEYVRGFWERHGATILDVATRTYQAIKDVIFLALEFIGYLIDAFVASVDGDWTAFWAAIRATTEIAWYVIKLMWETTLANIKSYWSVWSGEATTLWDGFMLTIRTLAEAVWQAIKDFITERLTEIRNHLFEVITYIDDLWKTTWDAISTKASDIWEAIKTTISTSVESARDTIQTTIEAIQTKWEEIWDAIKTKITDIWSDGKDGIVGFIIEKVDNFWKKIEELADNLKGFKDDTLGGLETGFGYVTGAIQKTITKIQNWIDKINGSAFGKALKRLDGLIGKSPSPLAIGIMWASKAMREMTRGPLPNLINTLNRSNGRSSVTAPTYQRASVPVTTNNNNRVMNLSMDNTINTPMDLNFLRSFITQTVIQAMQVG